MMAESASNDDSKSSLDADNIFDRIMEEKDSSIHSKFGWVVKTARMSTNEVGKALMVRGMKEVEFREIGEETENLEPWKEVFTYGFHFFDGEQSYIDELDIIEKACKVDSNIKEKLRIDQDFEPISEEKQFQLKEQQFPLLPARILQF